MKNIAILASGKGTNAQKLLEQEKSLSCLETAVIITDQASAGVIDIAQEYNKPCIVIPRINMTKAEHEKKILHLLDFYKIDWIFLAGYMRLLSANFVNHYYDSELSHARIINIHPSLLPKYKGLDAYEQAFASSDDISGITVHFVDEGVDSGAIILQRTFKKDNRDSLDIFKQRGQVIEHKIYPEVLTIINNAILKQSYQDLL